MWILVLSGLTCALALLDLICKNVIERSLEKGEERTCAGGRISLRRVYNEGMAFNIGDDRPELVKQTSVMMTLGLILYQIVVMFRKGQYVKKTGLALMTAGAVSNTVDRCTKDHVVDYIGFETGDKKTTQITYNLGDFFIAAGAVLLVIASAIHDFRKKK